MWTDEPSVLEWHETFKAWRVAEWVSSFLLRVDGANNA